MREYGTSLSKGRRMGVVYFFLPPEPGREDGQEAWNPKLVVQACCIFEKFIFFINSFVPKGKGLWRRWWTMAHPLLYGPVLSFLQSFCLKWRKYFLVIAKVLAKDYVYKYIYVHVYSVQCLCLEACFAGRGGWPGNQNTLTSVRPMI